MTPEMICTVTPTINDGTVVRWYFPHDMVAVVDQPCSSPAVSATRSGVRVSTYLHEPPTWVMTAAQNAYETLMADPDADMTGLATHRRKYAIGGPLVPIADRVRAGSPIAREIAESVL
jgi:hypothetical protein